MNEYSFIILDFPAFFVRGFNYMNYTEAV